MDIKTMISPHIAELEPYVAPDWSALAERAGLQPEQLIRLDSNENPYGPSPRVAEALAGFDDYSLYPDYQSLQEAVARYAGTSTESVILGNGGDEIIDLAVRLFVEPGEGVIVSPPAFGMYVSSTMAHRGVVLRAPRRDDLTLDVDAIEAMVEGPDRTVRAKLLFVTSPGNPDGQPVPAETIRRLSRLPLVLMVDEAYVEFGGESVVSLVDSHPNLIVLRTFSKWAGIAGLRLGYAVAHADVAEAMSRLRPPYNLNAAAVVAALATLADMGYAEVTVERIVAERERLRASLRELPGAHPVPSQANFVFTRFEDRTDAVRVTVGRPDQNDAFLAALQAVLKGEAPPRPGPGSGQSVSRRAAIRRQTRESEVAVTLDLDGSGRYEIDTGLGFLDHMLSQVSAHGLFDLAVRARGDLEVDEHHTVEDVAIAIGQALDSALGDRRGLVRMGHALAPLDEALAQVVVDLSGRPYAVVEAEFTTHRLGAVDPDLIIHFLETLAFQARMSLHARLLSGRNDHHRAEALFKALGRALDAASRRDPRRHDVPSTKGVL
jgi:histidinol-phosphate aminotransferase